MAKGYAEGPAAEEAERRLEELERGGDQAATEVRLAVYGSTADEPERHFIGWGGEGDPPPLFGAGDAWGNHGRSRGRLARGGRARAPVLYLGARWRSRSSPSSR